MNTPSLKEVDLSLTVDREEYKKRLKVLQEKARKITHDCVDDCPDPIKVDTKKSLKGEEVDNEEKRKILTRV